MIAESHDVSSSRYWSNRYRCGDTPWDLGREAPPLEALFNRIDFPHPTTTYQPQVAIPGCGYGHDALAFAERGYRVTAIDFAQEPLEYLRQIASLRELELEIVRMDVFDLPSSYHEAFDLIFEYTCYCAIDPIRRQEYANCLATILKPNGLLVGLFFPFDELERTNPPFTVFEPEIRIHFENAGLVLTESKIPLESHPSRAGRERLMLFIKRL